MTAFAHLRRGHPLPVAEGVLHRQIVELWKRAGRRDVLPCHVPNELADTDAKRFAQAKLGMWSGVPDLIFFPPAGEQIAFMEIKATGRYVARKGSQSAAREWIESAGHRWAAVNSFEEAHDQLRDWGLLRFSDARRDIR
jgi:hypothetical protein